MLKRIAIVLPTLRGGGAERVSIYLAREFLSCRGYAVDFVLMQAVGELLPLTPAEARVVDLKAPRFRGLLGPLTAYLLRERPDAILAAMWPLTSVAVASRRLAGIPARLVLGEHTTLSHAYASRGRLHRAFLRASIAMTYSSADAVVAVSEGVADDLAWLGRLNRSHIDVVHNPIPAPRVEEVPPEVEAAWGGGSGSRIVTVGSFKAPKNHPLLLRSFAALERPDARLMFVGDGAGRDEILSLARELGVADRVILAGFHRDPTPFYHTADLFVLSSDHEGLPTVLIEAMACGTPVVSTDCPSGPAEILENGRWGHLVPVGDASALAQAMGAALAAPVNREALKRRAADFAPAKAASRYLELLFEKGETE